MYQYLLEHPTLVMFDGLDEVFDRTLQSTVIDDIIRFTLDLAPVQAIYFPSGRISEKKGREVINIFQEQWKPFLYTPKR